MAATAATALGEMCPWEELYPARTTVRSPDKPADV